MIENSNKIENKEVTLLNISNKVLNTINYV